MGERLIVIEPSLLMLHRPQKDDFLNFSKGKPVAVKEKDDTGVFLDQLEYSHEYIKPGNNLLFQMRFLNKNIRVDG